MIRAMRTAATGMKAQQRQVETIANNIANVNTTAFKKNRLAFRSLLYQTYRKPGANVTKTQIDPTGLQVGTGTEISSSVKSFVQGDIAPSSGKFDVAIKGEGFYGVTGPTGELLYTRDGSFRIDSVGTLVTADGFKLIPTITIPPEALAVTIGADGNVVYTSSTSPLGTNAGQIQLNRFTNPAGLEARGDNFYIATASSGVATQQIPGVTGTGTLKHGYLESSNVQVVDELIELIQAQRNYELNSRTIRVSDEMMQQVNQMAR